MKTIYSRPDVFTEAVTTYCGGCGHGLINKLMAELIDELQLRERGILVWPIGCSVYADKYYRMDAICALHGRAPALATGIKRALPDKFVLVYQGDGDLVSEGMSEIMHAAVRGENFTVIFVNNAIYGMTGGQMAPTTLLGQVTSTSPHGRSAATSGYPVNMAEIMARMPGVCYSERVTVNNPQRIAAAKKAMRRAFTLQFENKGLSFVEVLSPCPTGWGKKPVDALAWVDEQMIDIYPLGVFKTPQEVTVK
ncbi:thiamine pyrophosphate-dependent enzyme [Acetonema longum]|uniref:Thiamine pyrophosphate tpp-binding domain-containing protein n=1 Tax=Acetonema longum DSM 6540 TaxID=1009370 RepID=F7NMW6_9FIRM|nr:thiamine pyrophosphate-dependent enzyme [Acetonema longum]EGO62610.1 thiamine pyrophosphate tpp-binding domain-containing protein [Acetonema longum DSM 6540]